MGRPKIYAIPFGWAGLAWLWPGWPGVGLGLAGLGLAWPALPGLAWHWPGLTKKPAPDDPRFPYPFLRNRLGHGPPLEFLLEDLGVAAPSFLVNCFSPSYLRSSQ